MSRRKSISAREANQHFSRLLRDVAAGNHVTVTRRGTPVAQIGPVTMSSAAADGAWGRLLARLEGGLALGGKAVDRDALYER